MARSRPNSAVCLAERVAQALGRGSLVQWIQVETAAEVGEAKALLAAAKARHIQVLTADEIARRQNRLRAEIGERASAVARAHPAGMAEVPATPAPMRPAPAVAPAVKAPRRRPGSTIHPHPVPIAAE